MEKLGGLALAPILFSKENESLGKFFHIEPSNHSILLAGWRDREPVAYFIQQVRSRNYFYLGQSGTEQLLCIKLRDKPYRVVMNEDMTRVVTLYKMAEEQIQAACWNTAGFEKWLG